MDLNVVATLCVEEHCGVNVDYSRAIVENRVTMRAEYQCPQALSAWKSRERDSLFQVFLN